MNTEENAADAVDNLFKDFGWDGGEDVSFEPAKTETQEIAEEIAEADPTKEVITNSKGKQADEVDNDSIFADFSDDETEEEAVPAKEKKVDKATVKKEADNEEPEGDDPEDSSVSEDEDVKFYSTLGKELKEKGIFTHASIEDDEEIDEDKFFELQEQEVEGRADEIVNGLVTELKNDPTAAALIKFVKNGGKSEDFFNVYAKAATNKFPEDFDLTQKKNQEKVIRHYLAEVDGLDQEEIEEKLEWYEEKGKTEDVSGKYHKKIVAADAKAKTDLFTNQAKAIEVAKKNNETLRNTISETLTKSDTISNFPFSAQEKKELPDFITKATVKVANGYITPFQAKMQDVMKNPEKLVVLMKLLRNDFDTKDLATKITTKVTEKAKSTLKEAKKSDKTLSNNGSRSRSLADMF